MFFAVKREWRGVDVSMSAIFRSPTLKGFAAEIDRMLGPVTFPTGNSEGLEKKTERAARPEEEDYEADARKLTDKLPDCVDDTWTSRELDAAFGHACGGCVNTRDLINGIHSEPSCEPVNIYGPKFSDRFRN